MTSINEDMNAKTAVFIAAVEAAKQVAIWGGGCEAATAAAKAVVEAGRSAYEHFGERLGAI